ncbi:hypothetical protein OBA47_01185 [bacterium]|nr:hypothetical protein [bacterium]
MKEAYIFLDSTRETPQIIQHQIIKNFAMQNNIDISFYGAEFIGFELRHNQLKSYLVESLSQNYIFYTVEQFFNPTTGFDFTLIKSAVSRGVNFYFAAEKKFVLCSQDLEALIHECKISYINRFNCNREDLVNYKT